MSFNCLIVGDSLSEGLEQSNFHVETFRGYTSQEILLMEYANWSEYVSQ